MAREYWEYVADNTNTSVSSNDEESCLNILSLSYTHLPIHLKPCFLYLGVFQEDYEIPVSRLMKLWAAEGVLKPNRAKSLEQVGKDYLKDLIERNLLSATKLGCTGNVRYCKLHDLLRDMCLVEAQKESFLHIEAVYTPYNNSQGTKMPFEVVESPGFNPNIKLNNTDILKGTNSKRRIALHLKSNERYTPQDLFDVQPTPFLRSLLCDFELKFEVLVDFRLLRVFDVHEYKCYSNDIFQLVNSRYLSFKLVTGVFPSSIYMLWNLQTITFPELRTSVRDEIWKMPQLRHVEVWELRLSDPRPISQMDSQGDTMVLENLQTLSTVSNFRITEEAVRRIPNVVKLKLKYDKRCDKGLPHHSLNNVCRLQKLQSLYCEFPDRINNHLRDILGFPGSLRKLTLWYVDFSWEDITTKIGPLPHLEMLKLRYFDSEDEEWNPVEGHFLHLKYLQIDHNTTLLSWTGDSVHFPVLEQLVVYRVQNLKEIPSGIGDIATLRSIDVGRCNDSCLNSAKEILEEQQSFGNESICLRVNV